MICTAVLVGLLGITLGGSGMLIYFTEKDLEQMSTVAEMQRQKAELEAKIKAATAIPCAAALKSGDRFVNAEGQERIVVEDRNRDRYRLMGGKKFQLLKPIFGSKEAVIRHMRENNYTKRA